MDGVYVREYIGADYTTFDFMVINGKDAYGVFEGEGVPKSEPKTWTSPTKFTFETPYSNEEINAEISKGMIFFRGTGISPVNFKFVRDLTANVPIDTPFLGRYQVLPKTNPPKYVIISGLGAVDSFDVALHECAQVRVRIRVRVRVRDGVRVRVKVRVRVRVK